MSEVRRAVFLDRDGTVIRDIGYISDESKVEMLPGVAETLAKVRAAGYDLIIVSNQSGVARGYFPIETVHRINAKVAEMLKSASADVTAFYFCPHYENGVMPEYSHACDCRKPAPGLILRAARELGIDLLRSFFVGDSQVDVECGRNAGVKTILVRGRASEEAPTGSGEPVRAFYSADFVVDSIEEIIHIVLADK